MKSALIALSAMLVIGCTPGVTEGLKLSANLLPEELKDCKFYRIREDNGGDTRVVRCPNSSTGAAWKSGKSQYYSSTVETQGPSEDLHRAKVNAFRAELDAEIKRLETLKENLK